MITICTDCGRSLTLSREEQKIFDSWDDFPIRDYEPKEHWNGKKFTPLGRYTLMRISEVLNRLTEHILG